MGCRGCTWTGIRAICGALIAGAPPLPLPAVGSYDDYCRRQREYTSALTADSPEVHEWIEFAEHNGGSLPRFPLPLGDLSIATAGELIT